MAFDWYDYLVLAHLLHTQAGNGIPVEAAWRTAVSRAYYAAFGHAYQYACTYLQFVPRRKPEDKAQDHGRLKAHLQPRRHLVAQELGRLRHWRNACDYEDLLSTTPLPQTVVSAIAAAEYVFRSLKPPVSP